MRQGSREQTQIPLGNVRHLVWEGLNASAHNEVAAVCNEDIPMWVLATRDPDPVTVPSLPFCFPGCPPVGRQHANNTPNGPEEIDLAGDAANQTICGIAAPMKT